jgi:asparagine N-glycosylation enzyme membrane subunit Stt3
VALALFHFAIPFVLLLSRRVKREAAAIVKVAGSILFARLVDLVWLVAPQFHKDGLSVSWMDVTLPIALGAFWLSAFVRQLRGRAILPIHDPQFDETLGPIIDRQQSPRTAH